MPLPFCQLFFTQLGPKSLILKFHISVLVLFQNLYLPLSAPHYSLLPFPRPFQANKGLLLPILPNHPLSHPPALHPMGVWVGDYLMEHPGKNRPSVATTVDRCDDWGLDPGVMDVMVRFTVGTGSSKDQEKTKWSAG